MLTETEVRDKLRFLIRHPHETECLEFKEARNSFSSEELGKYFSALSNEANLRGESCGWLVFGVIDKSRTICGSHYRPDPVSLNSLKHEIAQLTGGVTFKNIYTTLCDEKRVILFEIPPASVGIPTPYKGHYYGRDGESLVPLSMQKIESMRRQEAPFDWSGEICPAATLEDLDSAALRLARRYFYEKNKHKEFSKDIDEWTDAEFLEKSRLTKAGKITKACIVLLGRFESAFHLEPGIAQITWKLEGEHRAYEHFGIPFLRATTELYARIRNPIQKMDSPRELIPHEFPMYEKSVILEALHNAVAHQDYALRSRIVVTEHPDRLVFESAGSFFEGDVTDYALSEKTPQRYRNRFLADAMVNMNMIDTMGYGIRMMFQEQRKRFQAMPDFDLSEPDGVKVTVHGRIIDPNYTALLMEKKDLPLQLVILLDNVQKQRPISRDEAGVLRREKLIEGRYPGIYVAAHVASISDDKAAYIRNRAFDDGHYKKLVVNYIKQYGEATRREIDGLLMDKLSDILSEPQKKNKIRNLLSAMSKKDAMIRNTGSGRRSNWVLNLDEKDNI